jgi:hypothetical protein
MKKLQSFNDFNELGLSNGMMAQIKGGRVAEATTTAGGSNCISTSLSASGCWAYGSDNIDAAGNWTATGINVGPISASDVSTPC